MENPINIDDLGVRLFLENIHILCTMYTLTCFFLHVHNISPLKFVYVYTHCADIIDILLSMSVIYIYM